MRLTPHGQLEQRHFGTPVSTEDAAALACKPGLGWGSSVLYDQETGLCLDVLPLTWSGSGRGDYRESPVELDAATDFQHMSHRISEDPLPMTSSLPQAHGGRETLEITLTQQGGLLLRMY